MRPEPFDETFGYSGLWDVKRIPRLVANGPPIDVFPTSDDPPWPREDDYIIDPQYLAES